MILSKIGQQENRFEVHFYFAGGFFMFQMDKKATYGQI